MLDFFVQKNTLNNMETMKVIKCRIKNPIKLVTAKAMSLKSAWNTSMYLNIYVTSDKLRS